MTHPASTLIAHDWCVNDTLLQHPATIAVFNAFGIDACCGGAASLADAAREANIPLEHLLHALRSVARHDAETAA